MKKLKYIFLAQAILFTVLCTQSCNNECDGVVCLNEGLCEDGICNCLEGYIGNDCGNFDRLKVQLLLNEGRTPIELFNGNIPLDSLYGKIYKGGLIFHLNTTDGTGLVAAPENLSSSIEWGCQGVDIPNLNNVQNGPPMSGPETIEGARIGDGLANTISILSGCDEDGIAAKLCQEIGPNWFLPSRSELRSMYNNLHLNGYGNFTTTQFYFTSTEISSASVSAMNFTNGSRFQDIKHSRRTARAAKAF